jgi:hypothetical protein
MCTVYLLYVYFLIAYFLIGYSIIAYSIIGYSIGTVPEVLRAPYSDLSLLLSMGAPARVRYVCVLCVVWKGRVRGLRWFDLYTVLNIVYMYVFCVLCSVFCVYCVLCVLSTVYCVLSNRIIYNRTLYNNRLVTKIFDEVKFSKIGLRMTDVPEALKVRVHTVYTVFTACHLLSTVSCLLSVIML